MPTKNVKTLFKHFIKKDSDKQETLEDLHSRINQGKLHLIWIKIPKQKEFDKDEVRTITLKYSPSQVEFPDHVLKMVIKKRPWPLYYTLFTPSEFDFALTKYSLIINNKVEERYKKPEVVQKFKTYNSSLFRIPSELKNGFEISYSFKPTSTSSSPMKIALATLTFFAIGMLMFRHVVFYNEPQAMEIFSRQVDVGLFVIGGSLLLPQLVSNQSVRARYVRWYLLPVFLGIIILIS